MDRGGGEASWCYGHFLYPFMYPHQCVWGKVFVFSVDRGEEDINPAGLNGRIA